MVRAQEGSSSGNTGTAGGPPVHPLDGLGQRIQRPPRDVQRAAEEVELTGRGYGPPDPSYRRLRGLCDRVEVDPREGPGRLQQRSGAPGRPCNTDQESRLRPVVVVRGGWGPSADPGLEAVAPGSVDGP